MSSPAGLPRRSPAKRDEGAFTLLELLVVIGLIAAMSFLLLGGLAGGGKSAALQAGQTTVANLLAAARTRAMAENNDTRLLVNFESSSPRYLRFVAVQVHRESEWATLSTAYLPDGIFVLPGGASVPPNLFRSGLAWVKPDGGSLRSALFMDSTTGAAVDFPVSESWIGVAFTPAGTIKRIASGPPPSGDRDIMVGTARVLPPDGSSPGDAGIQFDNPEAVRGMRVSTYGLAVLINDRIGF